MAGLKGNSRPYRADEQLRKNCMILVDTSVWVDHFRKGVSGLERLLNEGEVVTHPFIIGELACGSLRNREEILRLFKELPLLPVLELDEYLHFIDHNRITRFGVGFVDIHLIASVRLSSDFLWTFDKKLTMLAKKIKLAFHEKFL